MSGSPYEKALASFEALMAESSNAVHSKPARLIQESGQYLSSGYRHTASLEAEGFLRRDASGVYLQGTASLRAALSAFGLGHLAPVAQPVLVRLREATRHTAFLSFINQLDVHMGPYSAGRASRQTKLCPHYRMEVPRTLPNDRASEVVLVPSSAEAASRVHTLMIPIDETQRYIATLGFVLNPTRATDNALSEALCVAAKQVTA